MITNTRIETATGTKTLITVTGADPARRFATIDAHNAFQISEGYPAFEVTAWSSPDQVAPYAWGKGTTACAQFKTLAGAMRAAKRWAQI